MTQTQLTRLIAEFLGTMILVAATASGVMMFGMQGSLLVGLASGLTLMALIYTLGHISGAHFNPAVTIAFTLVNKFPKFLAIPYIATQLLGAIAGMGLVRLAFEGTSSVFENVNSFGIVASNVSPTQTFGIEAFLALILMLVIISVATDSRAADPAAAGLPIGIAVVVLTMVGGPLSGAALNPARAFGPAVWMHDWSLQWMYWVAPIVGMLIAAVVYEYIRTTDSPKGDDYGVTGPIVTKK